MSEIMKIPLYATTKTSWDDYCNNKLPKFKYEPGNKPNFPYLSQSGKYVVCPSYNISAFDEMMRNGMVVKYARIRMDKWFRSHAFKVWSKIYPPNGYL